MPKKIKYKGVAEATRTPTNTNDIKSKIINILYRYIKGNSTAYLLIVALNFITGSEDGLVREVKYIQFHQKFVIIVYFF